MRARRRRRSLHQAALCLLALSARPGIARACTVCGCGDSTLTVMNDPAPQPAPPAAASDHEPGAPARSAAQVFLDGHPRLSMELRLGRVRVGTPGVSEIVMSEERLEIAAAYSPIRSLFLVASVPLLEREASFHGGARTTAFSLGDVDVRAKKFIWTAQRGVFEHQVALQGGVKAPTAPTQLDPQGAPLPSALQPGLGAITPFAGLFYGLGHGPWSFYASATVYLPYPVRADAHGADSFLTTASLERRVGRAFAARIGLDTRLEGASEQGGQPDPNSGGFVTYLSPALVVSPTRHLILTAGAHLPVVQLLHGYHHEDGMGVLGVTYDL
jgi:hypothetical protein